MGRTISLFLVRAAGMMLAGLLLFVVFSGHAHAQAANDSYGLKRFPGDNYDTVPAGAGIPAPPAARGYAPVPGSGIGPNGTYTTLNGGAAAPQNYPGAQPAYPVQGYAPAYQPAPSYQPEFQPPPAQMQPVQAYQPAPAYQPPAQSAPQYAPQYTPMAAPRTAVSTAPYGYKAMPGDAPVAQQQPAALARPVSAEPYGYRPLPVAQNAYPVASADERADPYGNYQVGTSPGRYAQRANSDYVLNTSDRLKLTVYGETDLSGEFAIDGGGFIRLPLVGQVRAAGYTGQQLEQVIAGALSQGYMKSPRVSVEVSTYRPFYVIGAVQRPGPYPYVEHMNAMNAVAMAGGFRDTAVESVVFVRREGSNQEVEVPVDRTTQIHPGDVVKVHNTLFSDLTSWLAPVSGIASSAATAAVIQ
jgi:protein involved in polysaccharide export with SLBB domain